jgi:hypothetical protein
MIEFIAFGIVVILFLMRPTLPVRIAFNGGVGLYCIVHSVMSHLEGHKSFALFFAVFALLNFLVVYIAIPVKAAADGQEDPV